MTLNRRIIVAALPDDRLTRDHFRMVEDAMPVPGAGELLVRTRVISVDAANRAWMQGLTYRSALAAGQTMAGLALSEVVESRADEFAPGDIVFGDTGWQDYAVVDAGAFERQPAGVPLTHLLSLYGTSPLTAYHGLVAVAGLAAGETLLVSAAGGSVGVAVAQIGLALGARVIGIAGGAEKCRWLLDEVGLHAVVDRRVGDLRRAVRAAAPDGIHVYFDNVGGEALEAALFAMNECGRIACCGAVSGYDGAKPAVGPRGVPGLLVTKRLTMRGFLVDDFAADHAAARVRLRDWADSGALRPIEDIAHGLAAAPDALIRLLAGENRGKQMVVI